MNIMVRRRPPKKPVPEALTMKGVSELGESYPSPQDRALFYFCYLTGARVSEALAVKPDDIQQHESRTMGRYLTVRLLTRKNRKTPIRDVPVPMQHGEGAMAAYIHSFIQVEAGADGRVFGWLSRTNAWNRLSSREFTVRALKGHEIIQDYTKKVNPHYLRHCRLTHLVQHYGFNELQLVRFAGWTDASMAMTYMHLNWMDLAKVMSASNGGEWSW